MAVRSACPRRRRPARPASRSCRRSPRSTRRWAPRCCWRRGAGRAQPHPRRGVRRRHARRLTAAEAFGADVVLKVDPPSPDEVRAAARGRRARRPAAALQGLRRAIAALRDRKVTSFALELLPRITRAQSMDALTSQASIAGYKAVLMAADMARPLLPDAHDAGRHDPARPRCSSSGVGVAGLQAIATARRLGAVVEAYDVRSRDARAGPVARRPLRRHRHRRRGRGRLRARAHRRGEGQGSRESWTSTSPTPTP